MYTPSTEHSTGTAHTDTTGTAHTPTSMRAPPAPIPPCCRPSTGTTNHQPPHVPSAFAGGYHRQPCPATQTTGSAWEPRTASPAAPTAGTSTPATASGPRPQPHPPPRQPPQLLRVPHRHPPGPPGRVLRGGRGGPRMDHSRGHGQHTPAPPQPTPTPQWRRLERGGPPHPPRPIPPPPRPTPPRPTTPGPPSSSPDAGSVDRHGTRGDSSLPPNHLPPVQKRPRPTEGNTLPTQRTPLPGTPPPPRTTEAPGGLGVFSGRPPGRPGRGHRHADGPHGPGTFVRGLKTSLQEAHRWHARSPSPPQGQGGSTAPTPTRPRRPRQVRGPANAPTSRARRPDQGPGKATPHHPTPRPPGHTNNTATASAHHHHRTAAPKPCSPVSHHRPHTSTPCQDHHTRRARGHGTTNTTSTPPSLPTPTP